MEFYKSIHCTDKYRNEQGIVYRGEERCRERLHQYFITPLSYKKQLIALHCSRLELDPNGGCTVDTIYKRKKFTYIFRRSQLYRCQEFDTAVRQLLDQLLVQERDNDNILYTKN